MELIERLRKIMEEEFGITTDEELIKATDNMDTSVFGIFAPREKENING